METNVDGNDAYAQVIQAQEEVPPNGRDVIGLRGEIERKAGV